MMGVAEARFGSKTTGIRSSGSIVARSGELIPRLRVGELGADAVVDQSQQGCQSTVPLDHRPRAGLVRTFNDDKWLAAEEPMGCDRLGDGQRVEAEFEMYGELLLVATSDVLGKPGVLCVKSQ